MSEKGCRYTCSIYQERPESCRGYPWNFVNSIFPECIFVDEKVAPMRLRTIEEQLTMNTEKEIGDYCVSCGRCCFFGPAPCINLDITSEDGEDLNPTPKKRAVFNIVTNRLEHGERGDDKS
jgi:Fe-S-cluster containining protein